MADLDFIPIILLIKATIKKVKRHLKSFNPPVLDMSIEIVFQNCCFISRYQCKLQDVLEEKKNTYFFISPNNSKKKTTI